MGGQHLLPWGGHWTADRPARKIQLKGVATCQTSSSLVLTVGRGAGCERKEEGGGDKREAMELFHMFTVAVT